MIEFLKYRWIYFVISIIVIGIGLFSIIKWGYYYSIDFSGGTNIEYQLDKKIDPNELKKVLKGRSIEFNTVSQKEKIVSLRTAILDEGREKELRENIKKTFRSDVTLLRFETVGPVIGRETMIKTGIASLLAILGILVYMTFAFKSFDFAFSAILAMIHDFLVVVGSYSLFSHFFYAQVDTLFVTALLTTMSFSVHDTIVIFDKMREYLKIGEKNDIEYLANKALVETMVRSLNNSMTIIFMLLALTILGGTTIRFFVATLLVGTITGTYSSPFIATPLLVWLRKRKK